MSTITTMVITSYYCICVVAIILCGSRLTVVSREAKEEVPCDGLSTNALLILQPQSNLIAKMKSSTIFVSVHFSYISRSEIV